MPLTWMEPRGRDWVQYRGGRGHDDPLKLFQDLHEAVLEVGPPCTVLSSNDVQRKPPTMGWVLYKDKKHTDGEVYEHHWEFFINIHDLNAKKDTLTPHVRDALTRQMGRVHIGVLLQEGTKPEDLEEGLRTFDRRPKAL